MTKTPHAGRFATLNTLMKRQGLGLPHLLIELNILDQNISEMRALQPPDKLRLVAKSLPSIGLLRYIAERLWQSSSRPRLMVFHLPFLLQLCQEFPQADILMGKPLPINAMERYYRDKPTVRIQWLVDSESRLEQVIALAQKIRQRISINLELDVGMHRGGIRNWEKLKQILANIKVRGKEIQLAGFMGYDAHAKKAPWPLSTPNKAIKRSSEIYTEWLGLTRKHFPGLEEQPWCINGAGSPTLSLHGYSSPLNDFSMGSALLKPTDFDVDSLQKFEPAAWIATPVVKRLPGVTLPFLEWLPARGRDSIFLYGGRWMASPVSPVSMQENQPYGRSSNQQLMTIESNCGIKVDDYVFLRPSQSEAVLLQFGDILAVRGDHIVSAWPVLRNELSNSATPGEGAY